MKPSSLLAGIACACFGAALALLIMWAASSVHSYLDKYSWLEFRLNNLESQLHDIGARQGDCSSEPEADDESDPLPITES